MNKESIKVKEVTIQHGSDKRMCHALMSSKEILRTIWDHWKDLKHEYDELTQVVSFHSPRHGVSGTIRLTGEPMPYPCSIFSLTSLEGLPRDDNRLDPRSPNFNNPKQRRKTNERKPRKSTKRRR